MKPYISLKEAKRLSILKWEIIVANSGVEDLDIYPEELQVLENYCGFCKRWDTNCRENSAPCEFAKAQGNTCFNLDSLFQQWAEDYDVKLAQEILDLIKSIPEEEEEIVNTPS